MPEEQKKKISIANSGKKNYNWKGGSGTQRHQIMARQEYRQWRDSIFHKDNYTCQVCDQYGGYLHADHIQSWKDFPELRFEVSNGRTLCVACHYYITFKRKMPSDLSWGLTKKRG